MSDTEELPRLINTGPALTVARIDRQVLRFTYKNWRGEVAERIAQPRFVWFGSTEHHPEPQWLLNALDLCKPGCPEREFAMKDMADVRSV
jgi:hypothetical protein